MAECWIEWRKMNQKEYTHIYIYNNEEIWNNVIGSLRRITGNDKTIELRRKKAKKSKEGKKGREREGEGESEKVGELKK